MNLLLQIYKILWKWIVRCLWWCCAESVCDVDVRLSRYRIWEELYVTVTCSFLKFGLMGARAQSLEFKPKCRYSLITTPWFLYLENKVQIYYFLQFPSTIYFAWKKIETQENSSKKNRIIAFRKTFLVGFEPTKVEFLNCDEILSAWNWDKVRSVYMTCLKISLKILKINTKYLKENKIFLCGIRTQHFSKITVTQLNNTQKLI
jgi:hypothetical protein